jgi:predicted acetyltransferase
MPDIEIVHPVPVEESEAWASEMALTFLGDPSPEAHPGDTDFFRRVWDPDRRWGARSGGRWVGTLATRQTTPTVPGVDGDTDEIPADALTEVTVAATHRRRGVLTTMLDQALAEGHKRGDAVGILFAAEWPIYGRFGYAPATLSANYSVDTRRRNAAVRPANSGGVHQVEPAELGKIAPDIFAAARRHRAGNIDRPAPWWQRTLGLEGLPVTKVHGRPPNLFVHDGQSGPDGYLAWVATREFDGLRFGAIEVVELCAASDEAYRDLWAYLTGIDLVEEIMLPGRPVDEPVRWLMADGRALWQTYAGDAVWLRLLDVPTALSARRYSVDGRLTVEIVDDDRGGFAAGCYVLEGGPEGASCRRVTGKRADLTLHQRVLASAYLGGFSLRTKRAAGLVEEGTAGALRRADAMFLSPLAPWCATEF